MQNQRFVIVPGFCTNCQNHGFKFIDTEKELRESDFFHTMEDSMDIFKKFISGAVQFGHPPKFLVEKICGEFLGTLSDQIILLPIPPAKYSGGDILKYAEKCEKFYSELLFFKEIRQALLEWGEKSFQETIIFIPENFTSLESPWIYILFPFKEKPSLEKVFQDFKQTKSKQQARQILEQGFKDGRITKDELALALSKIEYLEGLPEQTHQEKMEELLKHN
jgi:hypothetical protein